MKQTKWRRMTVHITLKKLHMAKIFIGINEQKKRVKAKVWIKQ